MNAPLQTARPALKRGCRLSPASISDSLLLIPEGALRLQGPGRKILELCDGQRTLKDVVAELSREFPSADPSVIAAEVNSFLTRLQEKGALEFL
ncbi:MAG TPA: pyrroloquinoline quinone biosynthesis peptide chaperone PqqD [Acidobacteriaceae bacterium]|nr:pyrroloquinoline quinone biosynthesis peptide chaperone PqqD [Acidobacteriaceae bacterium]